MSDHFSCPHCGTSVPAKAKACPECGSDKDTGWSEEAGYLHLLPNVEDTDGDAKLSFVWQKQWVGGIAIILLLCFLAMQVGTTGLYVLLASGALGGGLYFLYRRWSKKGNGGAEKQLYQQLLRRTGGDRKQVERLLDYEQKLYPASNRLQLIQNAIYHWDRDRH